MAKKGPKFLLTDEIGDRIAREMGLGLALHAAAIRCGQSGRTALDWYERGVAERGSETIHAAFAAKIEKAKSDREQRLLAIIDAACKPDDKGRIQNWQAAAWKLERLHPEKWARPAQRVVVEGAEVSDEKMTVSKAAILKLALSAARDTQG